MVVSRYIYIYIIGVLTVNIEFMSRGLETGERQALASLFICFVPTEGFKKDFYCESRVNLHISDKNQQNVKCLGKTHNICHTFH